MALHSNPHERIAVYSFDRVNESLTSTANRRREKVHLALVVGLITVSSKINTELIPHKLSLYMYLCYNITVLIWVLPEDYCKKDPCNFNMEMFVPKVSSPCTTLGQLLANRILYAFLVGENRMKSPGQDFARFCAQSCSEVGQFLANSPSHGKLQGSSLQ